MADIYHVDGRIEELVLWGDNFERLEQLQLIVGGYVEIVALYNTEKVAACNEDGALQHLPINHIFATDYGRSLAGNVVVGSREELGMVDQDDEDDGARMVHIVIQLSSGAPDVLYVSTDYDKALAFYEDRIRERYGADVLDDGYDLFDEYNAEADDSIHIISRELDEGLV